MTRIFYREAQCVFLVYDITRNETFMSLGEWLQDIRKYGEEDARIYLIGNKNEKEDEREVSYERALQFAQENNLHMFFETSAKTGHNVEDIFSIGGKEVFLHMKKEEEVNSLEEHDNRVEKSTKDRSKQRLDGKKKSKSKKKNSCC
mmetsp:Transcript_20227/g.19170  ORF Transcript_20227/g.19170 Transcript_20227/m.19170 type:complete len:146 (-) Transcript_20227:66-503(-)